MSEQEVRDCFDVHVLNRLATELVMEWFVSADGKRVSRFHKPSEVFIGDVCEMMYNYAGDRGDPMPLIKKLVAPDRSVIIGVRENGTDLIPCCTIGGHSGVYVTAPTFPQAITKATIVFAMRIKGASHG